MTEKKRRSHPVRRTKVRTGDCNSEAITHAQKNGSIGRYKYRKNKNTAATAINVYITYVVTLFDDVCCIPRFLSPEYDDPVFYRAFRLLYILYLFNGNDTCIKVYGKMTSFIQL